MNHAISTWVYQDCPVEQAVELLAGSRFSAVELSGTGSALMTAWQNDGPGTTALLGRHGIAIASVHCSRTGRAHLGSSNRHARNGAVQENIAFLRNMAGCGIRQLVLHPEGVENITSGPASLGGAAGDDQYLREALSRLADCAGALGVNLAVENMQAASSPFASVRNLLAAIAGLGDHVGLCHDVGHSLLAGLDPGREMALALASGRLLSLHLHHVRGDGTDHLLLEDGNPDLQALLTRLDKACFSGQCTIELRPAAAVAPGDVLLAAAKMFL